MTEAQMNAHAAADPLWFVRYALGFMALCLKHYEDVLRAQHAALLARSRGHPDERAYAYANPWFFDGRDLMGNDPLFSDGGPPRYYGAVGDIRERNRLFDALEGSVRIAYLHSSAYAKLRSLHRRMWVFYLAEGFSPWQQIREFYRMFDMYASGANERAEVMGYAVAGAATSIAAIGSRLGGLGPRSGSMRQPGPAGSGRRTLPGLGPEPVAGSGRRTLPGLGPGSEEIGHASTDVGGRTPGPVGIRDTIEDVQYSSTLPGPPPGTRSPSVACEQMVETVAVETGGASGVGGRLIVPLTPATAEALAGSVGGSVAYYFPEGNFEARQSYAQAWQHFGGTGQPPEQGFVVRSPSGETELIALTFRPQRMQNARLAPMTVQQRDGIYRMDLAPGNRDEPNPGQPGSNFYQGQGGYEYYASDWRTEGGEGPPPEFGFLIKQPDGSVVRSVGYYRGGLGR